tara:strand:+ start:94 stop:345 length:252 start_codon:yes stop_codon:yes gene_type:complete
MTGLIYNALIAHFQAIRTEATAQLAVYLNNPTGISEHANLISDAATQVNRIADAQASISILEGMISETNKQASREQDISNDLR